MSREALTFLLAGLTAGVASVAAGMLWPPILIGGVGLFFFAAVLTAITLSGSWPRVRRGGWRYLLGMLTSAAAYWLGLFAFSVTGGYSPDLLGVAPSPDISRFGSDVGIGLIAAALVSSLCIELLVSIFTGRWSTRFFVFLATAGCVTVAVTKVTNVFFQGPFAFFGVLLPVGEALFCWIVGMQIRQCTGVIAIPTTSGP